MEVKKPALQFDTQIFEYCTCLGQTILHVLLCSDCLTNTGLKPIFFIRHSSKYQSSIMRVDMLIAQANCKLLFQDTCKSRLSQYFEVRLN